MITISTDKSVLDINFIYNFLRNSYWANDRSKTEIEESILNSLCFGMYLNGQQIGFARIITDKIIFSYLLDVFIDGNHQGKAYGQKLLSYIYEHPDLINVKNNYLHTKDAQKFYKKFGFEIYGTPEKTMIKK